MEHLPSLIRPVVKPNDLIEAHKEVSTLIQHALEKDIDYGVIPGTGDKPALLKPGAERLVRAFGCVARYILVQSEIDHDRIVKWSKKKRDYKTGRYESIDGESFGLYRYVYKCEIHTMDGRLVGDGDGSCSTMETKYIERPRDLENTILKMSQKRALVAATLNAFGLSDRFTQDIEEMGHIQTPPPPPADDVFTGSEEQTKKLTDHLKNMKLDDEKVGAIISGMKGKKRSQLESVMKNVLS